ncbi:MAG: 6-bladed beta-propeller [Acidobacteria bacterium]|nr:6-bladed beta-propeller [Acidobacteriota bacterium]
MTLGEREIPGADGSHFNRPTDVAILKDGSFYVSDGYRNTRVVKFSAKGKFQYEWGKKGNGPGEFNLPHGIATDNQGRVYVCDRSNARVQIFDPMGKYISEWKDPQMGRPYGISIGINGDVFVVDGGDQPQDFPDRGGAVRMTQSGKILDSFGSFGNYDGQFRLAHDVAVDKNGAVYVIDTWGMRVQKFTRLN